MPKERKPNEELPIPEPPVHLEENPVVNQKQYLVGVKVAFDGIQPTPEEVINMVEEALYYFMQEGLAFYEEDGKEEEKVVPYSFDVEVDSIEEIKF